jgi:hypothetical protein
VTIFEAHVTNLGDEAWPRFAERAPQVRLGFRWALAGEEPQDQGGRVEFRATVLPGAQLVVPMQLRAPVRPGTYTFEVDLLHEGVRWFGVTQRATVEVTPAPIDHDAEWIGNLHEIRRELEAATGATRRAQAEAAAVQEAWQSAHDAHENAIAESAALRAELEALRRRLEDAG